MKMSAMMKNVPMPWRALAYKTRKDQNKNTEQIRSFKTTQHPNEKNAKHLKFKVQGLLIHL